MYCTKISPDYQENFLVNDEKGGKFQGANKKDFSDADDLYTFPDRALPFWNDLHINKPKKYRFIRYLAAKNQGCHLAELEIYTAIKKIAGKAFAAGGNFNTDTILSSAADGDPNTSASSSDKGAALGFDLEKPYKIDKIRFYPKMRFTIDTEVTEHRTYVLKLWQNDSWVPLETAVADTKVLTFKNIPSHGLYLIKDIGKDAQQRIFTYQNGKQIWW